MKIILKFIDLYKIFIFIALLTFNFDLYAQNKSNFKQVDATGRSILLPENIETSRKRALEDAIYIAALKGGADINGFSAISSNTIINDQSVIKPTNRVIDFKILKEWVSEMRFERLGCFTYSHEENTHAFNLEDDVNSDVKKERANEIMELQSQISWELNQEKIGSKYKVVVDRKSGNYYIGRTEHDSPDVDNEVLVDATKYYLKQGDFVDVKIIKASDYDLIGVPI